MSKKPSPGSVGNSEAARIYLQMKEEEAQKLRMKEEASHCKKVTLPKVKFMEKE